MGNFERAIIQVSVEDVIRILEDAPVRGHFIPYVTIAEVLNRAAIAHLSIEKAVKFLIREAKGDIAKDHHLGKRLRELKEHNSASAEFLEDVFVAARSHYGIDHESKGMKHFRRLETYLKTTGSDDAFINDNGIRYWELYPTLENALLRQVHLSIHMELLYGLHEILIEPDRHKETVEARVERAVETAMFPNGGMAYCLAMAGESTAKTHREWLSQFCTLREALADAVKRDFNLGNELAARTARSAYETISDAKDPAVSHFARTLDILPPQPRDVIPDVEWLDGNRRQRGRVSTPVGDTLGYIELGPHGLWYITPIKSGPVGFSAKARSQTDARCYLGQLLTRIARVAVDGRTSTLRVVGEERHVFKPAAVQPRKLEENHDEIKLYTATLWDENHAIEKGRAIRIEAQRIESGDLAISDALSGHVQEVQGHQVFVMGHSVTRIGLP